MGSLGQGQIGSGIITSILDIINVASIQQNKEASPVDSAFYCFLAATLFICLDIVAFLLMINTRYYKVSRFKFMLEAYGSKYQLWKN